MTYKGIVNSVGYTQLTTMADIPDYRLGVGNAEVLESVPILIFTDFYVPFPEPTAEAYQNLAYEKVAPNYQDAGLTLDEFDTKAFYIGPATMGV